MATRYPLIDLIRGIAVILMIIFHFSFDLNALGFISISFGESSPFWYYFPRVIVFLFFIAAGLSLPLIHTPKIKWKKFNKRLLELIILAAIISLSTYFIFPKHWIFFGTLHSIALCSLLSLPFLKKGWLSLIIALCLIIPSLFFNQTIPWFTLSHQSMDYISPFPWLGVMLLGIFLFHRKLHTIHLKKNLLSTFTQQLGKKSLIIYILHQPIIYSLLYLLKIIK